MQPKFEMVECRIHGIGRLWQSPENREIHTLVLFSLSFAATTLGLIEKRRR
jgi:hypothetical protein